MNRHTRLIFLMIVACFALAALRIVGLLAHTPLLAIANSFDQARYTGCFDLFPDRPAAVRPDENSPNAPFEFYRFQTNPVDLCYGSSELLFQGTTAALYRLQLGRGDTRHSVRWIGALRGVALGMLSIGFCLAWWRRGHHAGALANATVVALVLADPSNTLYFNTFYAEASALLAAYAVFNLVLLEWQQPRTRRGVILLALAALLLATSKIQHLVLPLGLAIAVLGFGRRHGGRWPWQGVALLVGALLGTTLQFAQLSRSDPLMASIRSYNRADILFTGLLPAVEDPFTTTVALGMPAACAAHSGKAAWQLPGIAEDVCPGIEKLGRLQLLLAFAREPLALLRFLRNGVQVLNPWLPRNLGHVEGQILGKLPAQFVGASGVLDRFAGLRQLLFALPLLVSLLAWQRADRFALLSLMLATLMLVTFGVTLVGDGLADVAKQGHLIFNAALAWPCIAAAIGISRRRSSRALAAVPA